MNPAEGAIESSKVPARRSAVRDNSGSIIPFDGRKVLQRPHFTSPSLSSMLCTVRRINEMVSPRCIPSMNYSQFLLSLLLHSILLFSSEDYFGTWLL